jgi:hypothetical protein
MDAGKVVNMQIPELNQKMEEMGKSLNLKVLKIFFH